jgi:hypothetical protein
MRALSRLVVVAILAAGGLMAAGPREAKAQPGVPYGPYSMTRGQFNQYAPVYYPRLNNNFGVGYYSGRPRYYYGGRPRYYNRGMRVFPGRRAW